MTESNPYLYILMRTDLASMNPGKAVAQGSHAANAFIHEASIMPENSNLSSLIREWSRQTHQGFGTCITLGVNAEQMYEVTVAAQAEGFHANIVHDPTYPLRDGDFVHLIPLDTCAYVFGDKDALAPILADLNLMP